MILEVSSNLDDSVPYFSWATKEAPVVMKQHKPQIEISNDFIFPLKFRCVLQLLRLFHDENWHDDNKFNFLIWLPFFLQSESVKLPWGYLPPTQTPVTPVNSYQQNVLLFIFSLNSNSGSLGWLVLTQNISLQGGSFQTT